MSLTTIFVVAEPDADGDYLLDPRALNDAFIASDASTDDEKRAVYRAIKAYLLNIIEQEKKFS